MQTSGLARSPWLLIVLLLAIAVSFPANMTLATGELSWGPIPRMPTDRIEVGLAEGGNGKLYAIGGEALAIQIATVEEYNPAVRTWATRNSMRTPRSGLAVVAANNGRIYAIGGWNPAQWASEVEEYDPNADTWAYKSRMPTPRAWFNAAKATNGRIYAIGGQSTAYTVVSSMEEFNPATNTWTTKASMPAPRYWLGVAGASNGKIYVVGGADARGTPLSSVLEYDPTTDTWATKASLSAPRWNLRAVAAQNGKVYAIGGHDGNYPVSTVEEYDPITDQWTIRDNLPVPMGGVGATVASTGKIYIMGGTGAYEGTILTDTTPPAISARLSPEPEANGWNNSNVTVRWEVTDQDSGILSSSGCDPTSLASETSGTSLTCTATNNAGLSNSSSVTVKIDRTPPTIGGAATTTPNVSGWYKGDVTIHWTCSDQLSGLAGDCPGDTAATGEGSNLSATSPSISDKAGNAGTGTVTGIKIDRTAPGIVISAPAARAVYEINQVVPSDYSCADALSGLATCAGPVLSGSNLDTRSVGVKVFAVNSADMAGNSAVKTKSFKVSYGIDILYDQSKTIKRGSTVQIRIRVVDANHINLSSPGLGVRAVGVTLIPTGAAGILEDTRISATEYIFRYVSDPYGGSYVYNLSTKNLSSGTYELSFKVGNDPVVHTTSFQVK